jgi:hypothetical protein
MNRIAQIYKVFGGVLSIKWAIFGQKVGIFFVQIDFFDNYKLQKYI